MKRAVHELLEGLVDYAGLFPPSALPMEMAVANYAAYRDGGHAEILGRFVVPVARLKELESAASSHAVSGEPWRLSALAGNDLDDDAGTIAAFNDANSRRLVIDTVEAKAPDAKAIARIAAAFQETVNYCEIPLDRGDELLRAISKHGLRAKARTGGVTADAFPAADAVAAFIEACARIGVAFKATAGLHHPLRCVRPLTYAAGAPAGTMHGFLNVFLAAAFIANGMSSDNAVAVMTEESFDAFDATEEAIRWHDYWVAAPELARIRKEFAISFGSCSFEEPVEELKAAAWI